MPWLDAFSVEVTVGFYFSIQVLCHFHMLCFMQRVQVCQQDVPILLRAVSKNGREDRCVLTQENHWVIFLAPLVIFGHIDAPLS